VFIGMLMGVWAGGAQNDRDILAVRETARPFGNGGEKSPLPQRVQPVTIIGS
jgi:hypothetical protein